MAFSFEEEGSAPDANRSYLKMFPETKTARERAKTASRRFAGTEISGRHAPTAAGAGRKDSGPQDQD